MSFFITEKETEALVEQETRELLWPDGVRRPQTAFRITWDAFDYLVFCSLSRSEVDLVRDLDESAKAKGVSFEENFSGTVAYFYHGVLGFPVPE